MDLAKYDLPELEKGRSGKCVVDCLLIASFRRESHREWEFDNDGGKWFDSSTVLYYTAEPIHLVELT